MRKLIIAPLALAAICLPVVAHSADWVQFRGPSANGFAPDKGINKNWNQNPPKVLWTTPMTDNGFAAASVADGKVFVVDHEGSTDIVRAINLANGKDIWTYKYEDSDKNAFGYSRAMPIFNDGKLYTLSMLNKVHCLNAKTGKLVWSHDLQKEYNGTFPEWKIAYSPLLDKNKLIVMPGGPDAGVIALDKKTGKTLWKSGSNTPSYATPVLATIRGKKQYVIFDMACLQGLDVDTGAVLWSFPWKTGPGCNAAVPVVMGDSIFITTSYNHGSAVVDITPDGAKSRWENKDMQSHFSSPIFYEGYIYCTSDPGRLMCMDPKDGKVIWKQDGFEKGPLMGVDGVMIVMDGRNGDNVMVKLTPESYQELGRFKPLGGDSCWTCPVISNGKMIVRNKTTLACVAIK